VIKFLPNLSKDTQNWRTNKQIHAPKVRVVSADGKQVGVLEIEKALEKAEKEGLDLVEIAPKAKPPVVKIINFGKFRYQESKRLKSQKKKTKTPELKEIRFSPFIAEADYQTRIQRVKKFLGDKNKVRVVVKFKGRQMNNKQFGYDLLEKVIKLFGDRIVIDVRPKFIGRHLTMIISPTSKKIVSKKEEKNAKTKN